MLSFTEENYLKALLHLTLETGNKEDLGTNELAAHLKVKPATANDMLKKLKEKKFVYYMYFTCCTKYSLFDGDRAERKLKFDKQFQFKHCG